MMGLFFQVFLVDGIALEIGFSKATHDPFRKGEVGG